MNKKVIDKEAIIAEYLTGGISYRELGNKYGIGYKMINLWVMKYQGKERTPISRAKKVEVDEIPLSMDIKTLQIELRKAQLHNKLLNAIIDIAEEQLKIEIRKKSGTKQ